MIRYVDGLDVRREPGSIELPAPRCRTCGRHQRAGEWADVSLRPLDREGREENLRMCTCGACLDCHDRGERRHPACPPMTRR